jgi:hypothetical protein
MKNAAPISSPIAKDPDPLFIALFKIMSKKSKNYSSGVYVNVLNKSGLPFPNARTVTPAYIKIVNREILVKIFFCFTMLSDN